MLCLSALALDWLLFINISVENIAGWKFAFIYFKVYRQSFLLTVIQMFRGRNSWCPTFHNIDWKENGGRRRRRRRGRSETLTCLRENKWKVLLAITVPDSSDLSVRRFVFQTSTCYVQ